MNEERKRRECPFLKEEKVVFCKAFPLKKILPLDKVFDKENICLKKEHVSCPVYLEKMSAGVHETAICHYLGTENIIYCELSPIKKMIPLYSLKFEGPCSDKTYEGCLLYQKIVQGDEKAMTINVHGFFLEDALYYNSSHIWLRKLNNNVRVGLDDFGQFILGNIKEILLPAQGDRVMADKPFMSIRCDDGITELPSPVEGFIVNVNSAVRKDSTLVNLDPYGDGWLVDIRPSERSACFEKEGAKIFHGDTAHSMLEKDLYRLRNFIESEIGVTVADGGEIWRGLRETIGKKGSLLVKYFFGK